MAAGFSASLQGLDDLLTDLHALAQEVIPNEVLEPQLSVDLELPLEQINIELLSQIDLLKPYGIGNPEPMFVSRNVGVAGSSSIGKDGSHLSLKLFGGKTYHKGILFDAKNLGISGFNFGVKVDIAYTASLKTYNDQIYPELVIKDIKPAGDAEKSRQ